MSAVGWECVHRQGSSPAVSINYSLLCMPELRMKLDSPLPSPLSFLKDTSSLCGVRSHISEASRCSSCGCIGTAHTCIKRQRHGVSAGWFGGVEAASVRVKWRSPSDAVCAFWCCTACVVFNLCAECVVSLKPFIKITGSKQLHQNITQFWSRSGPRILTQGLRGTEVGGKFYKFNKIYSTQSKL